MSEYRILPSEFQRGVWNYILLERSGMVAIYEQRHQAMPDKASGFAVARIRCRKESTMPNGKIVSPREIFPAPSEFGKLGWFYMPTSKKIAYDHYYKLLSRFGDSTPQGESSLEEKGGLTHFDKETNDDMGGDISA